MKTNILCSFTDHELSACEMLKCKGVCCFILRSIATIKCFENI